MLQETPGSFEIMTERSVEERLAWLEGKSEEWAHLEQVMIAQTKPIEELESEIHILLSERDDMREQLNFTQAQAEEALEKCAILMRAVGKESSSNGAMRMKSAEGLQWERRL